MGNSPGLIAGQAALVAIAAAGAAMLGLSGGMVGAIAATAAALVLLLGRSSQARTAQVDHRPSPDRIGFGRRILEHVPTALIVITEKGRIDYANAAALALVPQIRIGTHFGTVIRAPQFVEAVTAALETGSARRIEITLPDPERILEADITQLPTGDGFSTEIEVIISFEDRTEAHHSARMRSDFIANASHELRTPLASLIGYIETLRDHGKDDPDAAEKFLAIMDRQSQRMRRLVDDLLSLSRIEMSAHRKPDDIQPIAPLIAEAATELAPVAHKAGVKISVALPDPGPDVACDRDQIIQVATNLIDNGIKYGGSQVAIALAPPSPAFPRSIGISFRDDGPGIPAAVLPRLTERFFRVNVAKSKAQGGTGLGLAIVKHILLRHGGQLEIASNQEAGSTFTIWLPEYKSPKPF